MVCSTCNKATHLTVVWMSVYFLFWWCRNTRLKKFPPSKLGLPLPKFYDDTITNWGLVYSGRSEAQFEIKVFYRCFVSFANLCVRFSMCVKSVQMARSSPVNIISYENFVCSIIRMKHDIYSSTKQCANLEHCSDKYFDFRPKTTLLYLFNSVYETWLMDGFIRVLNTLWLICKSLVKSM